jgi:hypothetical protein
MKEGDFAVGEDPDAIRARIANTRTEMDRTLDELGERLDPRNLVDDVIDFFRSEAPSRQEARRALGSAGRRLATTVRSHPIPSLLVGAGLGWLLLEQGAGAAALDEDDRSDGVGEKLAGVADAIGDKTSKTLHSATGAAREVGERARATGERVAGAARRGAAGARESLRHGYDQARQRAVEALDDYPLGAAAGALACGILAGLVIPPTRLEDRVLGEAADAAKRRMRSRGEKIIEKGTQAVASAMAVASEEAERQDLASGDTAEKAKAVAAKALDAAMDAGVGESSPPR